jgi:hypothetical protein
MKLETARRAGATCIYVYDFAATAKPSGMIDEVPFSGGPKKVSQAVLAKFPDMNVLAFQGTITEFDDVKSSEAIQSVIDWLANLDLRPDKTLGLPGLVHNGFAKQLGYIADDVFAAIKKLSPSEKQKPLIVTGHSQGGAIATIATKLLETKGVQIAETYTFAAPRSGDGEFIKSLTTEIFRIEFGCDIVPHVPIPITNAGNVRVALSLLILPKKGKELVETLLQRAALAPNYESAGTLYYSREYDQPIKKYADTRSVALYLERIVRLPFNGKRLIEDHHMAHYMNTLNT